MFFPFPLNLSARCPLRRMAMHVTHDLAGPTRTCYLWSERDRTAVGVPCSMRNDTICLYHDLTLHKLGNTAGSDCKFTKLSFPCLMWLSGNCHRTQVDRFLPHVTGTAETRERSSSPEPVDTVGHLWRSLWTLLRSSQRCERHLGHHWQVEPWLLSEARCGKM